MDEHSKDVQASERPMDSAPLTSMLGMGAVHAYDKASLERFLVAATLERNRLCAALEEARQRRDVAQQAFLRAADLEGQLRDIVVATQQDLAARREATQREVEAVLAAAELEAAARRVDGRPASPAIDLSSRVHAEAF